MKPISLVQQIAHVEVEIQILRSAYSVWQGRNRLIDDAVKLHAIRRFEAVLGSLKELNRIKKLRSVAPVPYYPKGRNQR